MSQVAKQESQPNEAIHFTDLIYSSWIVVNKVMRNNCCPEILASLIFYYGKIGRENEEMSKHQKSADA